MIKKSWWVDLRVNHARYRKRSPENSRTGALAYEATLRQKLARGVSIDDVAHDAQRDRTFEQFASEWFEEYVVPNNKYSEQRTKKILLNATLIPFFGKMRIAKITAHDIERYKAQAVKEGVTPKTIKNRLTVLNKCLVTAHEWLQLPGSPPKIKWPKCASIRTDYLSPEECVLLLSHMDGVSYEMALTALRTGMRQGELKGLQWSSIDWQTRSLAVQHSRCDYTKTLVSPKSNRERHIPLDLDVYEMLHKRKESTGYVFIDTDKKPFDDKRLNRRLTTICKKAGLRKITWHILRHTFASQLAMRGVPLNAVQQLMGHSNITTTMRYAHVAPSTLRTAIDMLNPKRMLSNSFGQPVGNQWIREQQKLAYLSPDHIRSEVIADLFSAALLIEATQAVLKRIGKERIDRVLLLCEAMIDGACLGAIQECKLMASWFGNTAHMVERQDIPISHIAMQARYNLFIRASKSPEIESILGTFFPFEDVRRAHEIVRSDGDVSRALEAGIQDTRTFVTTPAMRDTEIFYSFVSELPNDPGGLRDVREFLKLAKMMKRNSPELGLLGLAAG